MMSVSLSRRESKQRGSLGGLGSRLRRGVRQAHRLLEFVVGLAFFVLAAGCISLSFNQWYRHQMTPSTGLSLFYMFASFSLVLLFCGLYSFLKARSIR
jgi:TRAP-type C4-dicarboxylate transport system permease small subunit